jgi:CTP synthase (UTP-ammonia lyase)
MGAMTRTATVALVGDRSDHVGSHRRIPHVVTALREYDGLVLDPHWVATDQVAQAGLEAFDGVWILPGSPYRSEDGAVAAARIARERGIPLLATCGGFQHAVLEFARHVCGLAGVGHAENDPDAPDPLIVPLSCSLVGREDAVDLRPGSMAERILGVGRTVERYHCSYGLGTAHLPALEAHGMTFTGHDDDGQVRVAELPGHPFYLATLFQPELAGDGGRCHPFIRAFAEAATLARTR